MLTVNLKQIVVMPFLYFCQVSQSSSTSSILSSDSDTPFKSSDTCIIRVSMDSNDDTTDVKTHIYKSIMVCLVRYI